MAESFFATLEHELLAQTVLHSHRDANVVLTEFIERWYNEERQHSTLRLRKSAAVRKPAPSVGASSVNHVSVKSSQVHPEASDRVIEVSTKAWEAHFCQRNKPDAHGNTGPQSHSIPFARQKQAGTILESATETDS